MSRLHLALASLAAFALLGAGFASAAGGPIYPKSGAWTIGSPPGSFTLKKGTGKQKDKIYVSGLTTEVTEVKEACKATGPVTVLGKFPLKSFRINGADLSGVGKPSGFELLEVPAKVLFGGMTYNGSFNIAFTTNGKHGSGRVTFDYCTTTFRGAKHN
ncbi:MAG TPA: hypothetical protein VHR18_04220 [Solirubrobacterales bacterium]|nr:hypothetical protein [Solirubrobacterales bacterium]